MSDDRMERVKRALREQGLDDGGASPHGWRCAHPDRYPDYCTCVDDVAQAVLDALDEKPPRDNDEHAGAIES